MVRQYFRLYTVLVSDTSIFSEGLKFNNARYIFQAPLVWQFKLDLDHNVVLSLPVEHYLPYRVKMKILINLIDGSKTFPDNRSLMQD